jgi:malate dehydrogenase (oxaloacetate-decarboxylating)
MATGRSDYPNQINNVLAFPGVFRGALDAGATDINEEMKVAAAKAIASLVKAEELSPDYIIPSTFNPLVGKTVAAAVKAAAIATGVCRKPSKVGASVGEQVEQVAQ